MRPLHKLPNAHLSRGPSFEDPFEGLDVRTAALVVIALGVCVFLLQYMQALIAPLAIGMLLFYALDPLVDAMERILTTVLAARRVYSSGGETFSLSEERFFLVGDDEIWVAVMKGDPLPARSYNHVAFKVDEADLDSYSERIADLGLEVRESRSRVEGEGRSLYFYDRDNHLFELHTGTLAERLRRYAAGRTTESEAVTP